MTVNAPPTPGPRFVEYFTLRFARTVSKRGTEGARTSRRQSLRLAEQRREAAELLWSGGQTAEALRLLVDAAGQAQLAFDDAWVHAIVGDESADVTSPLAQRLQSAGASSADAQRTADAIANLNALRVPTFDDEIVDGDAEAYAKLLDATTTLEQLAGNTTLTRGRVFSTVFTRLVSTLALLGLVGAIGVLFFKPKPGIRAVASAVLINDPRYTADKAIDGDPATEWQLPDNTQGYVDLIFSPARNVQHVRLLNSHNPPWEDRQTKNYRIELFSNDRKLTQVEGDFPTFDRAPQARVIDIAGQNVTRVRVNVLSNHRVGGGIAEVSVE